VLSLDAPAVVMTWQWLFAAIVAVRLHWGEVFVVGASVWLAYAADRGLEARRLPADQIVTARHRFYHERTRSMAIVWGVVLVADVVVALMELSRRELTGGLVLLVPTLLYVFSHQALHRHARWRMPKEFCVAALIASGSSVFVLSETRPVSGMLLANIGLFAVLCALNMFLISRWEEQVDETHGQTSLVRTFPQLRGWGQPLALALAGFAGIAAEPLLGLAPVPPHCIAASAILLATIDRLQPRLGWRVARVLADAALLTPLIPLLRGTR
jgi:hypothetical protein